MFESELRLPEASTLTNPAVPDDRGPTLVRLDLVTVEFSVSPVRVPAAAVNVRLSYP